MIGFETIGNATVTVFDDKPILTTDPWVYGNPYFGSWCHKYLIPKEQLDNIKNSKYIWLSHGHPDHIDPESLNLFKNNKKIIIFGTYYKNKITNSKNLKFFKFDINKPNKKIDKLLKKLKNGYIYYFATPKIDIKNNDAKQASIYKQYYINYPLELLKKIKNYNIKFFYPSTILTKNFKKNSYSMVKKNAEKILKIKIKNSSLNILRIEEINTKQNLSSVHENKYPQFIELLNKNLEYQKKIFFL
jgi:hypothetical protein